MKLNEIKTPQFIVYKVSGTNTKYVYYGFTQGSTTDAAEQAFYSNLNNHSNNRGTRDLVNENGDGKLSFSLVKVVGTNGEARKLRNKLKRTDPNDITMILYPGIIGNEDHPLSKHSTSSDRNTFYRSRDHESRGKTVEPIDATNAPERIEALRQKGLQNRLRTTTIGGAIDNGWIDPSMIQDFFARVKETNRQDIIKQVANDYDRLSARKFLAKYELNT